MEPTSTLTERLKQKQIIRCLSLLPQYGTDTALFVMSLDPDLQIEARKCIRKRRFIIQSGNRIRPLSPVGIRLTQDDIWSFLVALYQTLENAIDHQKETEANDIEREAKQLLQHYDRLAKIDSLSSKERQLLQYCAPIIDQLEMKRICGLEHLYGEIHHANKVVEKVYIRTFGYERMDAFQKFKEQGKAICGVFHNAMERVSLSATLKENLLDLMVQFYELAHLYEDMAESAERLLALQLERGAPSWLLSFTYLQLSDSYLSTFKTNPKWEELSTYYLEKACEYGRYAYEEEMAQSAQEERDE